MKKNVKSKKCFSVHFLPIFTQTEKCLEQLRCSKNSLTIS